ncbi:MAG TPA: PPC domain-containing protein, partial [Gemmataceae bacterium]|nr:PPC domain-containing protein [Gemmataceae bacterium]
MRSWRVITLASLVLMTAPVAANPPVASYIFPAGGQRGKTVDARVGGLFLYDKCGFELPGPGVDASKELRRTHTLWLEGPLLPLPDSQRQEDYPQDMAGQVKISADAPIGARHWRVWTSQGVTPARRFVVGDLPEIVEKELPGDPIPVEVTLPVTINGRIFPHEDVDIWSFAARKGQTISCEVEAARLGSPLDSRLEVLDPSGRAIAENDDTFGADSFIRFTAPSDGTYQVRIHDINYKGGQAYVYRLTLTADVRVDRAYPLGGRRGTKVPLTLSGQGLPQRPVAVELPADAPSEYAHRIEVSGRRSNVFYLDVDDLPEQIADEKKSAAAPGQKLELPAVTNGRIIKPGHADHWSFAARKGETFEFDLKAQRLGSPLSGVVSILDDKGKVLVRADSGPGGRADPWLSFTAPADGNYTARVESRFRSSGPEHAYRLRMARPAAPDFRLRLAADALTLNRGGQVPLKVLVERTGGFKEPIALTL